MYKNDEKKHVGRGFAMSILLGTAIGIFIMLVLVAIFSAFIASGKISEDLMRYIAIFVAFLGSLFGAITAVRRHKSKIMTVGLSVGALMFIVTVIGSLFSHSGIGGRLTLPFLIAFAFGGIVGGLVNLKKKKHKHA